MHRGSCSENQAPLTSSARFRGPRGGDGLQRLGQECGRFHVRQDRHLAPWRGDRSPWTSEVAAGRPARAPPSLGYSLPYPGARGLRILTGESRNGTAPLFQLRVLLIMPHTGKLN